jgi:hypothetical protein
MDEMRRVLLTLSCKDAIVRFFSALDAGRMDELAAAFASDGVWHRQGAELCGPEAVSRALAARPAGRVTAHLVQNLIVDLEDEDHARARYLALTYRHDAPGAANGPAPMGIPYSIAAYEDRLTRNGSNWLVQDRRSRPIFAS